MLTNGGAEGFVDDDAVSRCNGCRLTLSVQDQAAFRTAYIFYEDYEVHISALARSLSLSQREWFHE